MKEMVLGGLCLTILVGIAGGLLDGQSHVLVHPKAKQPAPHPRRVYLESPFRADTPERAELNDRYLSAAIADCIKRGGSPFASHAIFTREGVLDDRIAAERTRGIAAGSAWRTQAEICVVYTDLGSSEGMLAGIEESHALGQPVQYRTLGTSWSVYRDTTISILDFFGIKPRVIS